MTLMTRFGHFSRVDKLTSNLAIHPFFIDGKTIRRNLRKNVSALRAQRRQVNQRDYPIDQANTCALTRGYPLAQLHQAVTD
jgi:hypothetical protein